MSSFTLILNLAAALFVLLPLSGCRSVTIIPATIPFTVPDCLSSEEQALYEALNAYRQTQKLPPVPLSRSLTYVAQVHCRDLALNSPDSRPNCNMHSWSSQGNWKPCCYTPDHKQARCMWDKPRELTSYTGNGYEIAFWSNYEYDSPEEFASDAIDSWSKSPGHNQVMINLGQWKTSHWKAVGVGVYRGYAMIWFGNEPDPDQRPLLPCSDK